MSILDNILKLKKDKLKPVYLIYGEEKYILDKFKNDFINKFIDESVNDFNFNILDDKENFEITLNNQIKTPPIMGDKRFIVVRTEEFLTKKSDKEELLIKLFDDFPQSTILVILVYGKVDKRLKLYKKVKQIAEVIETSAPRYNNLDDWIKNEFKKRNKIVDRSTVKFLEYMFNNNLETLEREIEKITLYTGESSEKISLDSIKKIISKDRLLEEKEVFNLTDAIMDKKKGQALKILNHMIAQGAIPLQILGTIIWQVKLLMSVKELKLEGKDPKIIARELKVHHFPVNKCYQKSDYYTDSELELMIERLLEANLDIVYGRYEPLMALEMAIVR